MKILPNPEEVGSFNSHPTNNVKARKKHCLGSDNINKIVVLAVTTVVVVVVVAQQLFSSRPLMSAIEV